MAAERVVHRAEASNGLLSIRRIRISAIQTVLCTNESAMTFNAAGNRSPRIMVIAMLTDAVPEAAIMAGMAIVQCTPSSRASIDTTWQRVDCQRRKQKCNMPRMDG